MFALFKSRRDLQIGTVQRFRGINRFATIPNVTPDYALDCRNVIVGNSGGLEKLRCPVQLAPAPSASIGAGPDRIAYFAQGNGTRQVIGTFGSSLYYFDGDALTPSLIETAAADAGRWDFVTSNNILFGANGSRMMKWTGTAWQTWGIAAPAAAPAIVAVGQATIDTATNSGAVRNADVVTIKTTAAHGFAVGDSVTIAGVTDSSFDGTFTVTTVADNLHFTFAQTGANATSGAGTASGGMSGTYKWRYAYGNSVTGHIGTASAPTAATAVSNGLGVLNASAPTDGQVNTLYWYRTLNGGSDYYLLTSNPVGTLTLRDGSSDSALNQATIAQLINDPPPAGKYLTRSQGRIYIAGIQGAPQDVAYSGYEQILTGRPEESFPASNRFRLAIGADAVRGLGVIQAGLVTFGESNQMYMLRGIAEDIVTSAPVIFSQYLEQLPWQLGCASHYSIASTPYGIVWLAADRTVQMYGGVAEPQDLGLEVYPILRTITAGSEEQCEGVFLNWLERDWYVLGIPANGVAQKNLLLVFDLDPKPETNAGIFVFDVGPFDSMTVIEDSNGQRKLVIGQNGQILQLDVGADTTNGITDDVTTTSGTLDAWWRSGYFGSDAPELVKMFRWGSVVTDGDGFTVTTRLIDDAGYTVRRPWSATDRLVGTRFGVNRKGRRGSVEIGFPAMDVSINVLELSLTYIPVAAR